LLTVVFKVLYDFKKNKMENQNNNSENFEQKYAHIKGWGVDADPDNEPTYPMKKYTGDDHNRLNYDRPTQQVVDIEILHSNERPGVTSVFGTSTPPSGLSGQLRRYAFKYSEGSYAHWLPLILADRINVIEGIVDDLKHGIIPNIFAEKGWKAEWKYNRKGLIQKVLVTTAVISVTYLLLSGKKKKRGLI
jgi:hypothetical protein